MCNIVPDEGSKPGLRCAGLNQGSAAQMLNKGNQNQKNQIKSNIFQKTKTSYNYIIDTHGKPRPGLSSHVNLVIDLHFYIFIKEQEHIKQYI